jgi:hypothetical protein
MHKILFLFSLALAASAGLEWKTTDLQFSPNPMDKSVRGSFVFRNTGDAPIAITRVRSSCHCTVATPDRERYAPGESGVIEVDFEHVKRPGSQSKRIYVFTDDAAAPMTALKVSVDMPKLVEISPGYVSWRQGEAPSTKTIAFTVLAKSAIGLSEVRVEEPGFRCELRTLEAGRAYAIDVTPKDTSEIRKVTLRLVTDHQVDGRPFTYSAHAGVLPARVASLNPTTTKTRR